MWKNLEAAAGPPKEEMIGSVKSFVVIINENYRPLAVSTRMRLSRSVTRQLMLNDGTRHVL